MAVNLYADVHVRKAVVEGLRLRGVDILTAQEDGAGRLSDMELLDRATRLGRVLFTQDDDLLVEAADRLRAGREFSGVIYLHQLDLSIGECISDLELIAKASDPEDWFNRVTWLPLR